MRFGPFGMLTALLNVEKKRSGQEAATRNEGPAGSVKKPKCQPGAPRPVASRTSEQGPPPPSSTGPSHSAAAPVAPRAALVQPLLQRRQAKSQPSRQKAPVPPTFKQLLREAEITNELPLDEDMVISLVALSDAELLRLEPTRKLRGQRSFQNETAPFIEVKCPSFRVLPPEEPVLHDSDARRSERLAEVYGSDGEETGIEEEAEKERSGGGGKKRREQNARNRSEGGSEGESSKRADGESKKRRRVETPAAPRAVGEKHNVRDEHGRFIPAALSSRVESRAVKVSSKPKADSGVQELKQKKGGKKKSKSEGVESRRKVKKVESKKVERDTSKREEPSRRITRSTHV